MILLIGLILIGIILLVLEILVLPGLIAGIVGGLLLIFGVGTMYVQYGSIAGNIAFASTVALTGIAIYASLKSKAWSRFGLKTTIDGRVNEVSALGIAEGDEGRALSALRPSGTAVFSGQKVEAQTAGEMLDAGSKVVVTKVLPNKVLVKMKISEL